MPVFLTGPRGVGKTTALRRALAESGLRARGLRTCFDAPRGAETKNLYLLPWNEEEERDFPPVLCARIGPRGAAALPEAFDDAGTALLAAAAADPAADIVLIDELGFLEAKASRFRAAVTALLAGPKPAAGAIRLGLGCWRDAPLGDLWEMTEADRADIPRRLAVHLMEIMSKSRET